MGFSDASFPLAGYRLRQGSPLDRALLVKYMQRAYAELSAHHGWDHLTTTVDQYLAPDTPLWWVEADDPSEHDVAPVACLWLGNAVDQRSGNRHAYLLLLYVTPQHRRRGIATALLQTAHRWAQARGDGEISLQVFCDNTAAIRLYEQLGYRPTTLLMTKPLAEEP